MNTKIIAIIFIGMVSLTSTSVSSALETKTMNQNQLKESGNIQTLFDLGVDFHALDVAVNSDDDLIVVGDYCTIKLDGDNGECIWGKLESKPQVAVDSADNIIFGGSSFYAKSYIITKYDKDFNLLFRTEYTR